MLAFIIQVENEFGCGRLDVCKSGVCGAGLNRNMDEASAFVRIWNRRMYVCGKRLQLSLIHI